MLIVWKRPECKYRLLVHFPYFKVQKVISLSATEQLKQEGEEDRGWTLGESVTGELRQC